MTKPDPAAVARDAIARLFMGARDVSAEDASGIDYHRADLAIGVVWESLTADRAEVDQ